jgi:rhamnogalacturonan acetylesterase
LSDANETGRLAASQLGGPAKGVHFVPHGAYSAQAMKNLGAQVINANYPNDHTHTSAYLADVLSQAFVLGLKCGTSDLAKAVVNATLPSHVGGCDTSFNSTVSALLR